MYCLKIKKRQKNLCVYNSITAPNGAVIFVLLFCRHIIFTTEQKERKNDMETMTKDGLIFSKDGKKLLGSDTELLEKLVIPEGTKEIDKNVFYMTQIASVKIPDSMKSVSKIAFNDCRYLNDIDFGNGCNEIEEAAFTGCQGLKQVTFPPQMRIIGKEAFYDCESFEMANFNEGLALILQEAFNYCYLLKEVTFPASLRCLGDRSIPWATKITVKGNDLPHNLLRGVTFLGWNNLYNGMDKDIPLTVEIVFGEKHIFIPRFVDLQKISYAECALNSGMDEYLQTMYKYGTDGTTSAETAHAMYMYLIHTNQEPCETLKKYVKRVSRNIVTRLLDVGKYEEVTEFIRLNLLTPDSLKMLQNRTERPEIKAYIIDALEKTKKKTSMRL